MGDRLKVDFEGTANDLYNHLKQNVIAVAL